MFSSNVATALLAFVSFTCFTVGASAQTAWYVDDDNCPGPGTGTQVDPFCSIQDGIDAATNGDECVVGPGTYNELVNFNGKAITLRSSDGADMTTIDGTGLNGSVVKCVSGEGADTVLDGFTITGGTGSVCGTTAFCGGGMYNVESSPTVTNCTFSDNSAWGGGGMKNDHGSSPTVTNCTFIGNRALGSGGGMSNDHDSSPTVTNCAFSANTSVRGGGMSNDNDSSPTVANCAFSANTSVNGGGMYNGSPAVSGGSNPTVTNCTFSGNTAYYGGGMYNGQSSPTVTNCTFSDTSVRSGGGMYCFYSNPTVTNCAFTGNTAGGAGGGMTNSFSSPTVNNCTFTGNVAGSAKSSSRGGGMYNFSGDPTVTNCTFTGNTALNSGGGMYNLGSAPTLDNCIFSGNSADVGAGIVNRYNSSPSVTNCTFSGNTAFTSGGGMNDSSAGSGTTVTNCILWGNSPNEIDGAATVSYSDVAGGFAGVGNIDDDPLFVNDDGLDDVPGTEDDDLRLLPRSPAVDAGDNNAVSISVTTDLDGNPRFIDDPATTDTGNGTPPIVDMGAYEFLQRCGNGVVNAGEECDDGLDNSDTDPDACRTDCRQAWCGDGVVDTDELCDDGGESATCDSDCTVVECGDGTLNVTTGEECDDGLDNSDTEPDSCRTNCVAAHCCDGVADTGEECDTGPDKSDTEADACRTDCRQAWCGDGVVDTGEECDDGNTELGDGCDGSCEIELAACCVGTACRATVEGDCLDSGGVFFGFNSTCDLPDADGDGLRNECDGCPTDSNKIEPGICGCGRDDNADSDGDGVPDCDDQCLGVDDAFFAPDCIDAIPTVSQWGLIVLTLLLLTGNKIKFGGGLMSPKRHAPR